MKSSIKIDFIDRGTGKGIEPVIRIERIHSEDPRDKLICVLFENVGSQSYLQFNYSNHKQVLTPDGHPDMEKTILLYKPEQNTDELMSIVRMAFCEWAISKGYSAVYEESTGSYIYNKKKGKDDFVREPELFSQFLSEKANHSE